MRYIRWFGLVVWFGLDAVDRWIEQQTLIYCLLIMP